MSPLCRKSHCCAACGSLLLHGLLFASVFFGTFIAYEIPDVPAVESMYITLGDAVSGALPKGETMDMPLPLVEEAAPQPEEFEAPPEPAEPEPDSVSVKPEPEPEPVVKPKAESKPKPAPKPKAQQPVRQQAHKQGYEQGQGQSTRAYGHPLGTEGAEGMGGSVDGKAGQQAKMNAISALLARLEREKRYPNSARRMGLEGQVLINVELDKQGAIRSYRLEGSADAHPILQKSAMQAMERVYKKWQPVAVSGAITVQIPIRFELH